MSNDIFPSWQIEYQHIRQPHWPDLNSLSDLTSLPEDVVELLETQHGFPSRFQRPCWYTKWFRLCPGPTHALVEVRTNRIWLVTDETEGPEILRSISKILYSKIYTAVIDLNGTQECLDNACCMDWYTNRAGVWYDTLDSYQAYSMPGSIHKLNCELKCQPTSVSRDDEDLQQQMMFLYSILLQLQRCEVPVGPEMLAKLKPVYDQVVENIKIIFQTELYCEAIKLRLLDYVQTKLTQRPYWSYARILFDLFPYETLVDEI